MTAVQLHPVATAMHTIQKEMGVFYKERNSCLYAIGLTVLAGEHAFIIGSPGTGKTHLVKNFFQRFAGASFFTASLSKTTPAEKVLGPTDIPRLRDLGELHRKFNGFLPTADLAMLDELGKMSPTLGHDLLNVLNERHLDEVNGGRSTIDLPLSTVIGGSNELLTQESDDAAAAWDRFLVRLVVNPIQETGNFIALLGGDSSPAAGTSVDWADVLHVIKNVVPAITLPNDVLEVIAKLRETLKAAQIIPSDRRWMQSMKLLKANAFMEGRSEVSTDDIQVLRHTLWENPAQIAQVERATLSVSNPIAEKALDFMEKAEEIAQQIRDAKGLSAEHKAQLGNVLAGSIKVITGDLGRCRQEALAAGSSVTKLDEVQDAVNSIKVTMLMELLDINLDTMR